MNLKSITEAAALLGLNHSTVFRHCRAGTLRAERVGHQWQIELDEIERFRSVFEQFRAFSSKPGPKGKTK